LRKANTIPDSGVLIQPRGKKQYTRAFPDSDMAKNQRKKNATTPHPAPRT
jgi:hypothetical protein